MYKCHVQSNLFIRKTWSCLPFSSNNRLHPTHFPSPNPIVLGLNETKTSVLLFCGTSDVVCLTVALLLFPFSSYYSQDVKLRPELSGSTFESGLAIKGGQQFTRPHEGNWLFRTILPSKKHD